MAKGKSQPVDAHVGRRMKERRTSLGLSQKKVAEAINLSLRQVQKYEEGIDRVGASRLFDIARVLDVPVNYFFQDLETAGPVQLSGRQRLCLEVSRNFSNIEDERHQQAVSQLCRILAAER